MDEFEFMICIAGALICVLTILLLGALLFETDVNKTDDYKLYEAQTDICNGTIVSTYVSNARDYDFDDEVKSLSYCSGKPFICNEFEDQKLIDAGFDGENYECFWVSSTN